MIGQIESDYSLCWCLFRVKVTIPCVDDWSDNPCRKPTSLLPISTTPHRFVDWLCSARLACLRSRSFCLGRITRHIQLAGVWFRIKLRRVFWREGTKNAFIKVPSSNILLNLDRAVVYNLKLYSYLVKYWKLDNEVRKNFTSSAVMSLSSICARFASLSRRYLCCVAAHWAFKFHRRRYVTEISDNAIFA